MKTRSSNIELLKLIGIILIILSHSVPYGIYGEYLTWSDLNFAVNKTNLVFTLLRSLGSIGNIIFIISSCYYLCDSTKTKKDKIVNIIIDVIIIQLISSLIYIVYEKNASWDFLKTQIFSITYGQNWFINCYILYYLIHPYLNIVIKKLKKLEYIKLNLFLIIVYGMISIFHPSFYGNQLIGFVIVHLLVAFEKKYLDKFSNNLNLNIKLLIINSIIYFGYIVLACILNLKFGILDGRLLTINSFYNVITIMIGISVFNIFKRFDFSNSFINLLSSMSLLVYVIHANQIIGGYFKGIFYDTVKLNIFLRFVILFLIYLIFSFILSYLYKVLISKYTKKISDYITNYYGKIINKKLKKIKF